MAIVSASEYKETIVGKLFEGIQFFHQAVNEDDKFLNELCTSIIDEIKSERENLGKESKYRTVRVDMADYEKAETEEDKEVRFLQMTYSILKQFYTDPLFSEGDVSEETLALLKQMFDGENENVVDISSKLNSEGGLKATLSKVILDFKQRKIKVVLFLEHYELTPYLWDESGYSKIRSMAGAIGGFKNLSYAFFSEKYVKDVSSLPTGSPLWNIFTERTEDGTIIKDE